jgi:PAS domain S-box-containing protein
MQDFGKKSGTERGTENRAENGTDGYLDLIPTAVMAVDREFNVLYLNPAGAAVAGVTPEAAKGRKCYDLMRTPHCRTRDCQLHCAMSDGGTHTAETVVDPNGKNVPIEYTGTPIRNEKGEIIGALEFVLDISARKAVVSEIKQVANRLANNDLTAKAAGNYGNKDFDELAADLNRAIESQAMALGDVARTAQQLAAAGDQIASSSQTVAQGASEQAASLEETSSALEEMAGMTQQNADNTKQAKGLSETARDAAKRGHGVMDQMMSAMEKIRSSAESTAQIIRDINEIAFQTNLLALNAAVEAARAGEAGRGFAVVAEEVRNLAQRAKEAAQKTEDLIKESVSVAEEGQGLSKQAGGELGDIVESVSKVSEIVAEIAAASEEQSRGIQQVNYQHRTPPVRV